MQFYHLPYSHYCAKVRVALLEKSVPFEITPMPGGSTQSDEFLAINPQGKVPVIVDGATTLGESSVILEYLEDKYPSPTLLPASPEERADARWLMHFHDARVGPGVVALFALFGRGETETEEAKSAVADFEDALKTMDSKIKSPFFLGADFHFPDCIFALSTWYAWFLLPKFARSFDADRYPQLFAWFVRARERASVRAVVDDTVAALGEMGIAVP